MSVTDHPQTYEIMAYEQKNDELKNEVLDLKSKLLQAEQEKQELTNKVVVHIVIPQIYSHAPVCPSIISSYAI